MRPSITLIRTALVITVVMATGCASSDLPTAPTASPATASETAPEEFKNTLRWTTASEVDNFGFDVYRASSEDGPFTRITTSIIPGAGTTDEPQKYVYVDDAIDPTRGYFYYIESISIDSVREKFSPVIAIGPKQPAAE